MYEKNFSDYVAYIILGVFCLIFVVGIIITFVTDLNADPEKYIYKTRNGSFGYASDCRTIDGRLVCSTGDKKVEVTEYERNK